MPFLVLNVTFFCLKCCIYGNIVRIFARTNKDTMTERTEMRINKLLKVDIIKKINRYGYKSLTELVIHLLRTWNEQNK